MFTAYSQYWKNMLDFKSRSKRSEFWWPFLIISIFRISFYLMLLLSLLLPFFRRQEELKEAALSDEGLTIWSNLSPGIIFVIVVWALLELAHILPSLTVAIRRLKDAAFHWTFSFFFVASYICGLVAVLTPSAALLWFILAGIAMAPAVVLCAFPSREKAVKPAVPTYVQAQPQVTPVMPNGKMAAPVARPLAPTQAMPQQQPMQPQRQPSFAQPQAAAQPSQFQGMPQQVAPQPMDQGAGMQQNPQNPPQG